MTETKRTAYNEILGRRDGEEIVMLDDTFEYSSGFKGATGSRFEVASAEEVQERLDNFEEYVDELWRMVVAESDYTGSLEDWVENNFPGDDSKLDHLYDDSYSEHHDAIRKAFDLPDDSVIYCTGGGRMFPDALDGLEWLPGKREKFEPVILEAEGEN